MGDPNDPDKKAVVYTDAIRKEFDHWNKGMVKTGNFCMNEHDSWARSLSATHGVAPLQDGVSSCYRCPLLDEPVTIWGMSRRSDLNGARGEIIDGMADERGRIAVRVYNSSKNPDRGSRRMMVQVRNLVPSRPCLPPLSSARPPLPDECSSACSLSRAGSIAASSVRGRGSRAHSVSGGSLDSQIFELPETIPEAKLVTKSHSETVLGGQKAKLNSLLQRASCTKRQKANLYGPDYISRSRFEK